tara:strand:+ start:3239 stop:3682 length:444 start_codon:yes stop_codon:yes gene_type:complete
MNSKTYSDIKYQQLLDPVTVTADANSASVDLDGYESLCLLVNVGESGDTLSGSVYIELEVEESVDDSTWTDVADADLTNYLAGTNDGTFALVDAAAEDDARFIVGYKGTKQYVRVVINVTGTHTNGTPIAVTGVLGTPRVSPVNVAT